MVVRHIWCVWMSVAMGIAVCLLYTFVVIRTPTSCVITYAANLFTDEACSAIDTYLRSECAMNAVPLNTLTHELLDRFPFINSVEATLLPTRQLFLEIHPHRPRYCINRHSVVCDGGFVVSKAVYDPRVYASLMSVTMVGALPPRLSAEMYHGLCSIMLSYGHVYDIVWKSDTAIWLYAKKQSDFALVLALGSLDNDTLTRQIDDVAVQLIDKSIKKSPSKDWFRVLDARFADQLIVYTTQGDRG